MRQVEHAGCRIAYVVRGTGPPVLLIQGVGVGGDGWRPQVDELALTARHRVRSLSLLCTFASGKAAAPLTLRMLLLGLGSRVGTRRMRRLRAMRAADLAPRLRELAGVLTLVVSGAHDPIAPPRLGRALAAGIPGARYVEFPDASHGLPIQFPGRVNALLLAHFKEAAA